MKLYKNLLLSSLLSIPLGANAAQEDDNDQSQSFLLRCPNEILITISSYLKPEENLNFRQTCKVIKGCVDATYDLVLEKDSNNFLKRKNEEIPLLLTNYLKSLIRSKLEEKGYLFAPQGSNLEKYLSQHYSPIELYPFIKQDIVWAQELLHAYFDQQLPQEKIEFVLDLLTGYLPINRIYSTQEADPSLIIQKFKENHHEDLIKALNTIKKLPRSFSRILIENDFFMKINPILSYIIQIKKSLPLLCSQIDTDSYK